MNQTRSNTEIIAYLDEVLEAEFTFIRTEELCELILKLKPEDQAFVLDWVKRVASTNTQLGYRFVQQALEALVVMDHHLIEVWALHAMDEYDRSGLRAAMVVFEEVEDFAQFGEQRMAASLFEEQVGVLLPFMHGLSGRRLKLETGEQAYTDTETLYLPKIMAQLHTTEDNFKLYKASVAFLWAQTRFGSFRIDLNAFIGDEPEKQKQCELYACFERLRLDHRLAEELPGLYREMQGLKKKLGELILPDEWQKHAEALSSPNTRAEDSLRLAQSYFTSLEPLSCCYQGSFNPAAAAITIQARLEKEKAEFRVALRHIVNEIEEGNEPKQQAQQNSERFELNKIPDPAEPEGFRLEMSLDDQPVAPPDDVKGLMTSILQDLGEIPEEYLVPAGPGEYDPSLFVEQEVDPDDVWKGTYHEEGAFLYNEWDYRRQNYRKQWCAMREKPVPPVYDDFVATTLQKYHGMITHLRKTFEGMRDEDRLLKRQVQGDDVDIDALVEALADSRDGSEMDDRLFTRMHRSERNIAVVFMVDMSGSTKGWINEAEREALILLCEALETLQDRYAIYGFSGMTRKRCELYTIKTFEENYDDEVKARISGIQAQDYTRMGFAIRHLSSILNGTDARTRILITLSDGKPDDYDSYKGDYGVEDTRRALLEAKRAGIHPYCITIDETARDYLPHMYGPAAYTVVSDVRDLPFKVSDIYRRLTV